MKPFPLPIPPVLQPYILDFQWDLDALHALPRPVTQLPIAEPADPVRYHEQYARTLAADLAYPLNVVRRSDGRVTVLDGVHRVAAR